MGRPPFISPRPLPRFLDRKDQTLLEHKLDTFSSVYKSLTGKDVVFEFPAASAAE